MNKAEYNRRKKEIARREYALRVKQNNYSTPLRPFDTWYNDSFLTDALLIGLVINELGDENDTTETTNNYYEDSGQDSSTEDNSDSSSFDSSDDYSSDSSDSGFDSSDY